GLEDYGQRNGMVDFDDQDHFTSAGLEDYRRKNEITDAKNK
ncbi:33279_t:CDS:1, partial [Racocetra persica]